MSEPDLKKPSIKYSKTENSAERCEQVSPTIVSAPSILALSSISCISRHGFISIDLHQFLPRTAKGSFGDSLNFVLSL